MIAFVRLLVLITVASKAFVNGRSERETNPRSKVNESSQSRKSVRVGGRRVAKSKNHGNKSKKKAQNRIHTKKKRIFVKYKSEQAREQAIQAATGLIKDYGHGDTVVIEASDEDIASLEADDNIVSVETDSYYEGFIVKEYEYIRSRNLTEEIPWGLEMIQANLLDVGPHPVKVCLVDTGYAIDHPDLPKDIVSGSDAVSKMGDIWKWDLDFNGHGTHIAGTLSAMGNNNIGVVGAGRIPLHITRGLDDNSGGFESDVIDAVNQCIDNGAKIINLSLGGATMSINSRYLYSKVVHQDGAIVIAAAGNQGQKMHAYPASHPDVISVAAIYKWERYWEGSNYCDQVELAAPGYGILSTTTDRSAVHTNDFSFTAEQLQGSRTDEVSGNLVYCGPGNYLCYEARGSICLMVHDQTDLQKMLANCMGSNARGAIIFEANGQTIGVNTHPIQISVVKVPTHVGNNLMKYLGTSVSIGHRSSDTPEHTYEYFKGTSMAAPHVAAAAALVWSHFPQCSNHQIRYALAITAKDIGLEGCDWDYGYGIVKARAAYEWLVRNGCSSRTFQNIKRAAGGCTTVE